MLCNWCHQEILAGQELKSQGRGVGQFSLYEGTSGGSYNIKEVVIITVDVITTNCFES